MKKILSLGLSLLMSVSLLTLAGCGEEEASNEKLKLGLGVYGIVANAENATEETSGKCDLDTTIAAVLLDKDGKIVKCEVDSVSVKAQFDTKGNSTPAGEIKSKYESGNAYNMKSSSSIQKEWYEQADAFESTVIGKTLDQVKGIKTGDEALTKAGCTIDVNVFVLSLEKAVNNAKDSNATEKNQLKISMVYDTGAWKSATAETLGKAEVSVTATAIVIDDDKKVVAATNDCVLPAINFDAKGVVTSAYGTPIATKRELGDDLNMKAASSIQKEWYEQADAFAGYIVGKSADEITGVADDSGKVTEGLVKAGCTINVSAMIKAAVKAIES